MGRTLALTALTLGLALSPAVAQTNSTSDATVAPKIERLITEYLQAYNRHDAAALAGFYTEDAVFFGATGVPVTGRTAIEKFWATTFKQMGNPTQTAKAIQIHALGDNAWAVGEYTANFTGQNGPAEIKGHWGAVYVPEGGEWKVRMLTGGPNAQPAPMPASGSTSK
jgi:uncharacterized protein (TIGR02246 family)